jgi:hypothetical protein
MENKEMERHFNNNDALWDEKYFSIIKIWYIIFVIICLINEYLYYKDFHDNELLLIMIPFFNLQIIGILVNIREIINVPPGDKQYILNYYPEIYKKMFFPSIFTGEYSTKYSGVNGFVIFSFIHGSYIGDNEDEIIEDIRERWDTHGKILLRAIIILIVFIVITFIAIGLKNGL